MLLLQATSFWFLVGGAIEVEAVNENYKPETENQKPETSGLYQLVRKHSVLFEAIRCHNLRRRGH